jgi:hypothetical protein
MKHKDRKHNQEAGTSKSNRAAQQTQIVKPKPDQQETLHQIRQAYYDSITRQVEARKKARASGEVLTAQ